MNRKILGKKIFLLIAILAISLISFQSIYAGTPGVSFDFIEITDFHGYMQNNGKLSDGTVIVQERAGVLGKAISDIKKQNPNSIILSGGDMFQGTPLSNILKGKPVIDMMNVLGFNAIALGNHEYDWGIDSVIDTKKALLLNSKISVLAANVYDRTTGKPVSYTKPYIIITKTNVKIGIIGIVDDKEFPSIIMPSFVSNVDFKDPAPIVTDLAEQLRKKGVSIIVVLAHLGAVKDKNNDIKGNLIDFAQKVSGVDAIFGGHTHTVITTTVNGIPVMVGGNYGTGFINLKLTYTKEKKTVIDDMKYVDLTASYNTSMPVTDPEIMTIVKKANEKVGPMFSEVIGVAETDLMREQSAKPFGDSSLGNWTSEVTRKAANADFGFGNNGGLRIDMPKGNITVGLIFQIMPFDNTIITVKMTGAQIKTLLEQAVKENGKGIQIAGLSFKYDMTKPDMQRVFDMKKSDGTPLDLTAIFTVATNNFVGTGGDGFQVFTEPEIAKTYVDTYILVRDAFINAAKKDGKISCPIDNRITPGTF